MFEAEEVQFHIKFVINKSRTKVLFAEAGSDFADVLLSFLVMPLRTIVEVLDKHYGDNKAPVIGCLNTLYKSAKNLDIIHFQEEDGMINSTHFDRQLSRLRLSTHPKSEATFIISDDLRVLPIVEGSIFQTLRKIGIAVEDMDGTETRNVTFGLNEIISLLKESLVSLNPLTALIFSWRRKIAPIDRRFLLREIEKRATLKYPKNMILKVILQKSTNEFLFAQADGVFVNFLLSMLTISLGRVEWCLGSNYGLYAIDKLHRFVACTSDDRLLKDSHAKDMVIKPKPTCYSCNENENCFLNIGQIGCQSYVNGARMYMVSDDLTVAPLGVTVGLSVINELKILLSDIKEVEMKVGLDEALRILKEALTSTTALTDGLIKPFLEKQELKQQSESESEEQMESESESEEWSSSSNF